MAFKKMLQKFGVGGPSVDTVLADPRCRPGAPLSGEVRLRGGEADAEIEHIALSLVTRAQGHGGVTQQEFHRVVVSGATRLAAKEERAIPFTIPLPWGAPLTEVSGQPLPGVELGLRTELSIAKAVDKGDLDPVYVAPTESQDAVLAAVGELGFMFKSSVVEVGQVYGVRQELPFHQELDFFPPARYGGRVEEVELTMIAAADGLTVLVEVDKRSPMAGPGGTGRFEVGHEEALETDWVARIGEWLDQVVENRHVGHLGHQGYGGHGHGYQEPRGRRGPGMGGIVAGAAAGVVGGMMLGEMFDGDDGGDGGDDGGGEE